MTQVGTWIFAECLLWNDELDSSDLCLRLATGLVGVSRHDVINIDVV